MLRARPAQTMEPRQGRRSEGYPKMDGENNGNPYCLMDDLGENPLFLETPNYDIYLGNRSQKEWYTTVVVFF